MGDEEEGESRLLSDFPTNRCPLSPDSESCIRGGNGDKDRVMGRSVGEWGMILGVSADSVGRGRRGEERKSIAGWHGE